MKTYTITITGEEFEAKEEMQRILDVDKVHAAMDDFSMLVLRQYRKYGLPPEIKTPEETIEFIENLWYEILKDREL